MVGRVSDCHQKEVFASSEGLIFLFYREIYIVDFWYIIKIKHIYIYVLLNVYVCI